MGCDIHIFVEHFNGEDWKEVDYEYEGSRLGDKDPADRLYKCFAYLANVRNYDNITPQIDNRGLPWDLCQTIRDKVSVYDSCYHSITYALLSELLALLWKDDDEGVDLTECAFKIWLEKYMTKLDKDYDNVRIIINFDN